MRSIAGWFLVAMGICGVALQIDELLSGKAEHPLFGSVLFGSFALGGWALVRSAKRARLPPAVKEQLAMAEASVRTPRDVEQTVLVCAKQHGGRVTIAEVAAETHLSFTEAKEVLEALARAGACTIDVTEQGAFLYEFNGLMPRQPERKSLDA